MENIEKENSNELYHTGRLGMKWGQHIFGDIKKLSLEYKKKRSKSKNINENTKQQIKKLKKQAKEEARKRKIKKQQDEKIAKAKKHILDKYGVDYGKDNIPNKTIKPDQNYKTKNNKLDKKGIQKLPDTELRDRINRLESEKRLMELQNYHASVGQKFVNTVIKDVVVPSAVNAGKDLVTQYMKKYGDVGLSSFEKGFNKKKKKD